MAKPKKSKKAAAQPAKKAAAIARPAKGRKTMEQLEQENEHLKARIAELEEDNAALQLKLAALDNPDNVDEPKWQRGILPGREYIKTDPNTGQFYIISKEEWDRLA